jgi:phosphatidylglycerol:prolipoprotein diacylglycerol transferase
MDGITVSINPVIWQFGNFELRWYSIAIFTAIAIALVIGIREGKYRGLPPDTIYSLLPWVVVSGLIGARLFHIIDYWEYYVLNPAQILQFQQGGLAIWGGLVAGVLAVVIYAKVKHIRIGLLADTLVPALLVAQIVGRLGCIINGDAYGGATTLPWGFIYVHPNALVPAQLLGIPTHPYPVYEMIWNGLILLLLMRLRPRFTKDGFLFLSYLSLYSFGRFILSFVRQESALLWGLQQAQIIAVAVFVASMVAMAYLLIKPKDDRTVKSTVQSSL